MSTSRIFSVVANAAGVTCGVVLAGGARIALSHWEVGTNQQTGVISNTGERGFFVKTNEMILQKSEVANGTRKSEMEFSLYENEKLKEKANKYCADGTFVRVEYKKYLMSPWFAAGSTRKVTSIEPVVRSNKI